jgi:hypothetical protein
MQPLEYTTQDLQGLARSDEHDHDEFLDQLNIPTLNLV